MQRNKGLAPVIIFFCILMAPLVNGLTLRADTAPLEGVQNDYAYPNFNWTDYYSGAFQGGFEDSFSHGFSGVRTATRLYNELRFRAFRESDDKTVVCKDGSIIYRHYLNEYLGLDEQHHCTQEQIDSLAAQLRRLTELARAQGKTLAVVLTPSKADYWEDRIPEKYFRMERYYTKEERGARLLTAAMEREGVPFVDGPAILAAREQPFDVFTETGIHYTREAAIQVLEGINRVLAENGVPLKHVASEGREYSDEPRRGSLNNDDDIWLLMNVFSTRKTTYSYPIEAEILPDSYVVPKVFWQGGSFIWPLYELLLDHEIVADEHVLFYVEGLYDANRAYSAVETLSDPQIVSAVAGSNVILLEVNEEYVCGMGSGFLDALESMLQADMPRLEMETIRAGEFRVIWEDLWPQESYNGVTWRWSKGSSAGIRFANVEPADTLQVTYWVPYSVYAAQDQGIAPEIEIEVWLNGSLYRRQPCSEDSVFTVQFPPESLLSGQENVVEIRSPYAFALDGSRGESSFQVLSAGRVE